MARVSDGKKRRSPVNIISVDVGTTTIACHHFDGLGISLYNTTRKVSKAAEDGREVCQNYQ